VIGILLMNLGTPDEPTPEKVAVYLKEFLMDPQVIDIPKLFRLFLVHVLVVPKRALKSALAYQKIWTERGSPLKFHSQDLTEKVRAKLGNQFSVELAMRYQNPSIRSVLEKWKAQGITEIRVLPLYPQYALASTLSSELEVKRVLRQLDYQVKLSFLKPFYRDEGYVKAFAENVGKVLEVGPWDHLLLSYHGLPERQIRRADSSKQYCFHSKSCCNEVNEKNQEFCYRAQCFETSRLIGSTLNLSQSKWSVAFQSRLGVTAWIKPYTDLVLNELADAGVKNLVIACPAFTADCLETLEEIEMRANEQFIQRGGKTLRMVPSLNSSESWVDAVCKLAQSF